MKVEQRPKPLQKVPYLGAVETFMLTYERPSFLLHTVQSYLSTSTTKLTVFDDGSTSPEKQAELKHIESLGVEVVRFNHAGLERSWANVFEWAREHKSNLSGAILCEDDLTFARGWEEVLRKMHDGVVDLGLLPGAMSCFRFHPTAAGPIVELRGVKAFACLWYSFQINLVPFELVRDVELVEKSIADMKERNKVSWTYGFDLCWLANVGHMRKRSNFISEESWVRHDGFDKSMVVTQGKTSLRHSGINLVKELEQVKKVRVVEVE